MTIIDDHKRLGWWILEQKLFYYHPRYGDSVADSVYDKMEDEYRRLSKVLGVKPYSADHIGFPCNTASGQLVLNHPKFDHVHPIKYIPLLNWDLARKKANVPFKK